MRKLTDEVGALVLADNYDQTGALSVAQSHAIGDRDAHGRFMRALEREGRLNRTVEVLPSNDTLRERGNRNAGPDAAGARGAARLRQAAAVRGDQRLAACRTIRYYMATLKGYFPKEAAAHCPQGLAKHRLRREIIGTVVDNEIVNRGGPLFMHRLKEASGARGAGPGARLFDRLGRLRDRRIAAAHQRARQQSAGERSAAHARQAHQRV